MMLDLFSDKCSMPKVVFGIKKRLFDVKIPIVNVKSPLHRYSEMNLSDFRKYVLNRRVRYGFGRNTLWRKGYGMKKPSTKSCIGKPKKKLYLIDHPGRRPVRSWLIDKYKNRPWNI